MKITNWCKKLSATLVAAGILAPAASYAIDIPLGDPSFEAFAVPAAVGYAYSDTYRPTSAWVDDLDSPPGYTEDDGSSSWLYNTTYGESSATHRRAAPRTGDQAMHGLGYGYYNAQKTDAVFEAGRTYTFSLWAQGDIDAKGDTSRVWMYIFDGSLPFSQANSLIFERFAPDTGDFINRDPAWTAAESQANWTQISLSHSVLDGAPEIGHPVGVGFWIAGDGAVDDASLSSVVPEPATVILVGMAGLGLLTWRRRE